VSSVIAPALPIRRNPDLIGAEWRNDRRFAQRNAMALSSLSGTSERAAEAVVPLATEARTASVSVSR